MGISEQDKLAMKALLASVEGRNKQRVNREKTADPLGPIMGREQMMKQEDEDLLNKLDSYKPIKKANGGMIDRAAIRGKTRGKIC